MAGASADLSIATPEELDALAGTIDLNLAFPGHKGRLDSWTLVTVHRAAVCQVQMHAIGFWYGDVWATTALTTYDAQQHLIRTKSGSVYRSHVASKHSRYIHGF